MVTFRQTVEHPAPIVKFLESEVSGCFDAENFIGELSERDGFGLDPRFVFEIWIGFELLVDSHDHACQRTDYCVVQKRDIHHQLQSTVKRVGL
jgi:hypothetical protein